MRFSQECGGVSRPLPSYIDVTIGAGFGSTNSNVRVFTTVQQKMGSGVSYISDPVAGDSFVIKEAGIYSIHYVDGDDGSHKAIFGISVNADPTSALGSLNRAGVLNFRKGRLVMATPNVVGTLSCVSWCGPLVIGDVIRPHCNNFTPDNGSDQISFTICKVA